jgi:hypothetical protein
MKTVVSIVPRLPPAVDGVGDYSLKVAQQLRKDFGIYTHFIVSNPLWVGDNNIDGFSVSRVSHRKSEALLNLLDGFQDANAVLLQYVLHGYSKKGCPFWLINALEEQRKKKRCFTKYIQWDLVSFRGIQIFGSYHGKKTLPKDWRT